MSVNLKISDISELKPRITVFGTGGAGGNAVNNMIASGLQGVDFVVANTDAQALTMSKAERIIQMGVAVTEGLGAGSQPEVGRAPLPRRSSTRFGAISRAPTWHSSPLEWVEAPAQEPPWRERPPAAPRHHRSAH